MAEPEEAPLFGSVSNHLRHHARFYGALALGAAVFAALRAISFPRPLAAGGDAFFLAYLVMVLRLAFVLSPDDLDRRADREDEGILIVVFITLIAIAYSCVAIFTFLNQKHPEDLLPLALTIAGAPLGWFALHTISAFHYAYLYYSDLPGGPGAPRALKFPETPEPGPWEFLYFSFVIGMTAQVSDVLVQSTRMRRAVISHGVAAFFFNTVLIAMAVNAAVASVQTG